LARAYIEQCRRDDRLLTHLAKFVLKIDGERVKSISVFTYRLRRGLLCRLTADTGCRSGDTEDMDLSILQRTSPYR
jgi:hypothetical protein